jgi:diguanylate cyclase (GGDEF)-like protein
MAPPADAPSGEGSVPQALQLLQAIPLLQGLAPEQLSPLAEAARVAVFQPGERIACWGEADAGAAGGTGAACLILQGQVEVVRDLGGEDEPGELPWDTGAAGGEPAGTWLGPGDTVGDLALLNDPPPAARGTCYVARTPATCLFLRREDFLGVLLRHWSLAAALLRSLERRLLVAERLLAEHTRDPLTGLAKRAAAAEFYEHELALARRAAYRQGVAALRPLAVLLVDVDGLRHINERYGPAAGDDVLRAVAHTLIGATRTTDLVTRYDGDEFLVLLPEAGREGAAEVAARIEEALGRLPERTPRFTASIGTALVNHAREQSLSRMVTKARESLERAKRRRA